MSVGLSFLLVLPIPRGGSPLSRTISCSQILSNDWHVYRWCHICWVSFKIISHGMFLGPEKELGHLTPQGTQAMGLSLWSCYQWNHRWFMTMQDWRPDWPTVVDFDSLSPRLLLALKSSFSSNVSRSNPLPTNFLPHDRCNCVHVRRTPTSNHKLTISVFEPPTAMVFFAIELPHCSRGPAPETSLGLQRVYSSAALRASSNVTGTKPL